MFACRVTIGMYCSNRHLTLQMTPGMRPDKPYTPYDSIADRPSSLDGVRGEIFSCFADGQAFPEYLIRFKQVSQDA